jgi:two-component system response regulator AtoC
MRREDLALLTDRFPGVVDFYGMITTAPSMIEFFERVRRVARTDASVLVRGETGTGKDLVARAIHALSPRAAGPFQAVNCALLTGDLLASELFGHVRGSFTGAVRDRTGVFALADKGTLFLDEIAEIPIEVQARLLRVLQEGRFVPVGGTDPVQVDVRLVSATHEALRLRVEQGRFREDLMYRVRVVPMFLPRLADRAGDVEVLTWWFILQQNAFGLRVVDKIQPAVRAALVGYDWPGNVRELRNVIEHAFAIGEGSTLTLDDLPPELRGVQPQRRPSDGPDELPDRELIVEALRKTGGRKAEAAALLGTSRSTLWRKMRELGLR